MESNVRLVAADSKASFPGSVTRELAFLTQQTGQDELTLLSRALHVGLDLMYRQSVEQAFIDEAISRAEAVVALGATRVSEIDYAREALAQDIARGWAS